MFFFSTSQVMMISRKNMKYFEYLFDLSPREDSAPFR